MRAVRAAQAPFPVFASALQLGWRSPAGLPEHRSSSSSSSAWSPTASPLPKSVGEREKDNNVRPDASLSAPGENGQNEKVEENFVREFPEYRWVPFPFFEPVVHKNPENRCEMSPAAAQTAASHWDDVCSQFAAVENPHQWACSGV